MRCRQAQISTPLLVQSMTIRRLLSRISMFGGYSRPHLLRSRPAFASLSQDTSKRLTLVEPSVLIPHTL